MNLAAEQTASAPAADDAVSTDHWLDAGRATLTPEGRIVALDESLAAWLGGAPADFLGRSFWELLVSRCPEWAEPLQGCRQSSETFYSGQLSTPGPTPELPRRWYQLEQTRGADQWFVRLSSVLPPRPQLEEGGWDDHLADAAARRQMVFRLLRAEAQLENLVRRYPGVVFNQRPDGSFFFISPKIEALTGLDVAELLRDPSSFWAAVHEADLAEVQRRFRLAASITQPTSSGFRLRHLKTGRITYLLEHRQAVMSQNGLLLGYEGLWLDVTRQTIAEKHLCRAAWRETLALSTMGLAHDFNNALAGIHSLSETFLAQVGAEHPFREGLQLIKVNSLQASQLLQRMINLHRSRVGERSYQDLNSLVQDLAELVRKILPRRIEVKAEVAAESLPIYVDQVEFQQLVLNLALNAAEAMPDGGGLWLKTARHSSTRPLAFVQGELPRLPCVSLSVRDNGCGIMERHLKSIFDPFFTTKSLSHGSGLGLYNARVFVEKHAGAISVESTENVGTTFQLWLPQADFTEADRRPLSPPRRRHSLLVAGPPGDLVDHTVEVLRLQECYVAVCTTREAALEILHSHEYQFDALMVLMEPGDLTLGGLVADVRRRGGKLKTVLQLVGAGPDDLSTELTRHADLLISADMSETDMVEELNSLLADLPGRDGDA